MLRDLPRRPLLTHSGLVPHGRIFKLMRDGLLAEFASVVDAVACAVAVQREIAKRNAGCPMRDASTFVLVSTLAM
jgi:hypothetical protein